MPSREGGEREHGRLPPQDLRSRDRRHGHRLDLDVGARLISVDLQEHVTDAQGRALVMGDDDLDLLHVGHCRGMTTDVATGLPRDQAQPSAEPPPSMTMLAPLTHDDSSEARKMRGVDDVRGLPVPAERDAVQHDPPHPLRRIGEHRRGVGGLDQCRG